MVLLALHPSPIIGEVFLVNPRRVLDDGWKLFDDLPRPWRS
jgi:hypothetical protein